MWSIHGGHLKGYIVACLSKKRSRNKFESMVKFLLSKVSKHMYRKFSAKTRRYMLAYHHKKIMDEDGVNDENDRVTWSFDNIERMHKVYRSHCDVNCINGR